MMPETKALFFKCVSLCFSFRLDCLCSFSGCEAAPSKKSFPRLLRGNSEEFFGRCFGVSPQVCFFFVNRLMVKLVVWVPGGLDSDWIPWFRDLGGKILESQSTGPAAKPTRKHHERWVNPSFQVDLQGSIWVFPKIMVPNNYWFSY